MRYLAAKNSNHSPPITLVTMRGPNDCLTCVVAMLLGLPYEHVERAFGGNIDPSRDQEQETQRIRNGMEMLIHAHNRAFLLRPESSPITVGRRYWVNVRIHERDNALSEVMGHSIVVDEYGKVFDPNPEYGEFPSLEAWSAAVPWTHEIEYQNEMFEYSL